MDFELSEEHRMIQSLVRDFVTDRLKPLEREITGRSADMSDARAYLPEAAEEQLIKVSRDSGLWGAGVPEELGGAGLDALANCLIEEELAQTVVPFDLGDVTPLLFDCNENQREKYLLPALKAGKRPYIALIEPDRAADLPSLSLKGVKRSGKYRLDGRKVSFSRLGNDYFGLVFAVTDEAAGREGITCFLVDKDTPGFGVAGGGEAAGWRSQLRPPLILTFENCLVSEEDILGEESRAFHLGRKWLPVRRIVRAARSVGAARRLLEEAAARAQSWETFGSAVGERMNVRAGLADIAADIHACRLLVYEAAVKADAEKPVLQEAAVARIFAARMLNRTADTVTQIYGGPPFIAGLPMEQLCQDALASGATELALDIQRELIARDILKGLRV